MNKLLIATLGLAVVAISTQPVWAQDICGTHTVVQGDSLRSIANDAYGNPRDYRYLFEENRSKLGRSPHMIPLGLILDLPCRGTFTTANAVVEVAPPAPAPVVEVQSPPPVVVVPAPTPVASSTVPEFTLVGFSDNLPYSDANLLQGGLITSLIETALLRSEAAEVNQPLFVTRPESGLATSVLPDSFHLSFPWLLPDCHLVEFDADIRDLCENFTFSSAIFEAQMAMFALADGPFRLAAVEVDLVGARVCRPAALHTYDLLEDGMIEPIISLETATDLATCFDDLQNDIVDIVSVNGLTADVYFAESGRSDRIVELTNLATTHSVHAITANGNQEGLLALEYLNEGLREMLANGEWSNLARDYLLRRLN